MKTFCIVTKIGTRLFVNAEQISQNADGSKVALANQTGVVAIFNPAEIVGIIDVASETDGVPRAEQALGLLHDAMRSRREAPTQPLTAENHE